MPRLLTASATAPLLSEAARFIRLHAPSHEVLILAPTRVAADDFTRFHCGNTAGVHRFTLPQLVANLTASAMAERGLAPLNTLGAEALAARAVHQLRNENALHYFHPVAASPGFARALARTLRELRLESVIVETLIRAGAPGRDLAALHRVYEDLLAESRLADFPALLRLATQVILTQPHRLIGLPLLLLDIPAQSTLTAKFLAALAAKAPQTLAVLLEGDQATTTRLTQALDTQPEPIPDLADTSLTRLRTHLFLSTSPEYRASDETFDFFSAAGEGLECTEIARRIHRLAEENIPFDHIAITLRSPERYQPLLEEALNRASIPFHFTKGSIRPDPAGRAFLALLACAQEGYPATRFAEYLSLGQTPPVEEPRARTASAGGAWIGTEDDLLSREEYIPETLAELTPVLSPETPAAWERLIVDAAVVGGRHRWQRRLQGLENEFQLHLATLEDNDDTRRLHLERQIRLLRNLQHLALPVIERLDALPKSALWREWLEQLSDLAHLTLTHPASVLLALNELWSMGEAGPITLDEVFLVLSDRLRFLRRPPQKRRYGHVWIGSIEEARGQSFHAVFLPGLAEGIFPKKAFEDPLLLDDYRKQLDAALPLRDDRVAEERLRLHTAAAAAHSRLIVSYPRMDVTQHRARVPSFYAMEVVRAAEGKLAELKQFELRAAAGALTRLGWPAPKDPQLSVDALEFDLAVLQDIVRQPRGQAKGRGRYLFHLNPHLARSLRARYKRWEPKWSDADGLLHKGPETLAVLEKQRLHQRSWSASSLQHFAACPYRFLLHGIHQFRPRQVSAPLDEMDPLTRGSLFHDVLFQLSQRAQTAEEFHSLADQVLDEVAAKYEEDLAPAIPRVWRGEVEDLRADLKGWLRRRAWDSAAWRLRYAEYAFGMPPGPHRDPSSTPQHATIAGGVLLRGSIDWIELHKESPVLRITDHKTGKAPKVIPHHVGGGSVLQPLLYALAAEDLLQTPVKLSRLYYCTQRGGYQTIDFALTDEARHHAQRALTLIDEAIAEGRLPAAPAKDACLWCDYRMACGPREEERTRRKHPDDRLVQLRSLP